MLELEKHTTSYGLDLIKADQLPFLSATKEFLCDPLVFGHRRNTKSEQGRRVEQKSYGRTASILNYLLRLSYMI